LQILSPDRLRRHEHLRLLGPDLLSPDFDAAEALRRLRMNNEFPIGEAVMNQRLVAGIGNIYKSETLFLSKVDPFASVGSLGDEAWLALLALARKLMRRNLATQTRKIRLAGDGGKMWAYGRPGKPCFKCGTIILIRRQGDQGRTTFWCPQCQPPVGRAKP
jgi:endonuclease-8